MAIVIYGPMATGKTMHAAKFAQHYDALRVIEHHDIDKGFHPRRGDLILSNATAGELDERFPGVRLIPIEQARADVGLGPVPEGGFFANAAVKTTKQISHDRMAACPCECHENRCGSADIAMAQYALRLIERCSSPIYVEQIDEMVQRAGPTFAIAALDRMKARDVADAEVPF